MPNAKMIRIEYVVHQLDEEGELERYDDMTIKQFKALVTNELKLPGLVTVLYDGKPIVNLNSTIEYVHRKGKKNPSPPFHFKYDEAVAVAAGGYAEASRATAKKGQKAIAQGGIATGGIVGENGNLRGGDGTGGDGIGDHGTGGKAYAGIANAGEAKRDGLTVWSGTAVAGDFVYK